MLQRSFTYILTYGREHDRKASSSTATYRGRAESASCSVDAPVMKPAAVAAPRSVSTNTSSSHLVVQAEKSHCRAFPLVSVYSC